MKKGVKHEILLLRRYEMMGAHIVEQNVSRKHDAAFIDDSGVHVLAPPLDGLLLASQLELGGNRKPLLRPANETM